MKRPLGVTILALLNLLGSIVFSLLAISVGILGLFGGIVGIIVGGIVGIVLFVLSILYFLKFVGLWTMKKWGWYLVIILSIISLIISLNFGLKSIINIIWELIVIIYLWLRRRKFGVKIEL